jgi:IclR family transcriptional regulator, KDG regulon repressor
MGRTVQSLERGLAVLELLVKHGAMGVTALASELEMDKTIVHRILGTLQSLGYVSQDINRKYIVGAKLRTIGAKVLSNLDVRVLAYPYMQRLAEHTKFVSHLAKIAESRAIYIERVQHSGVTINSTPVGGEAPGYCSAAGKMLWAHLPQTELNQILDRVEFRAHTSNTIVDRFALQEHLARVREQGFALDNEEHRVGMVGVGAPILDHTGNVIASICVAEFARNIQGTGLDDTRTLVIEAAQKVSAELGYTPGN